MLIFVVILLCLVILSYCLFDINFVIRATLTYIHARFFRSTLTFLDKSEIYGMCFTTDIDVNLHHMNNTKFFRELEFGRMDFCVRAGLVRFFASFKHGTGFVAAGTILRYRKPLLLFHPYKVVTRVVWWDTRSFYVEQKIITLSDECTRAVGYIKFKLIDPNGMEKFVEGLVKPEISPDVFTYIEANDSIETTQQKLHKN